MDIDCPKIEVVTPPNWAEVETAFTDSPPVHFHQFWKDAPDENFSGGEVRTGWSVDGVWVYAVLDDEEIFNDEETRNAFFFLHGDVFEIFVRPENQEAYFEFHVGPANQQMQMRIPSASAFSSQSGNESETWKIADPLMKSWVQKDSSANRWKILVFLPFKGIVENGDTSQDWRISFSRYDYTQGQKNPVLSSTSPHAKLGFHRQDEWRRLKFR